MRPRNDRYIPSSQNTPVVCTRAEEERGREGKEERLREDRRNLGAGGDRGLSDYYSESSILESSARR